MSKKRKAPYWNFRVLAFTEKHLDGEEELYFEIHSVYYDKDGKPNGFGEPGSTVYSDCIKGIKWTLKVMKEAAKKPVLWGDKGKFPKKYKNEKKKD